MAEGEKYPSFNSGGLVPYFLITLLSPKNKQTWAIQPWVIDITWADTWCNIQFLGFAMEFELICLCGSWYLQSSTSTPYSLQKKMFVKEQHWRRKGECGTAADRTKWRIDVWEEVKSQLQISVYRWYVTKQQRIQEKTHTSLTVSLSPCGDMHGWLHIILLV